MVMKHIRRPINLVLLISICGFLVLTASEYINCRSDFPDEFLDIASASQNQSLPVFSPHRNPYPLPPVSLGIFHSEGVDLLGAVLRL